MDATTRLYLGGGGRWTLDPDGAVMRLDITTRGGVPRNALYRADDRGGWQPIVDEHTLSARERGLAWEVWPTYRRGEPYQAFRGVRAVDEDLLVLLTDGPSRMQPDAAIASGNTLSTMKSRFGYCDDCAKDAILALVRKRYS